MAPFWIISMAVASIYVLSFAQNTPSFPAFFIFGDSLVDPGNNNFIPSIARGGLLPYGIDFPAGATGRFTNGKTVADIICDYLGLPLIPPFLDPQTQGSKILQGVNYASGAAGILDSSGYNFLARIPMSQQIENFKFTVASLNSMLGPESAQNLIHQSLFSVVIGSNDYINNYFLTTSPLKFQYSDEQYTSLLISTFSDQLKELYSLGARTVAVSSVGPLGCIPSQIAKENSNGACIEYNNRVVRDYNNGLAVLLKNLDAQLPGSRFLYADGYEPVAQIVENFEHYGFVSANTGCCGLGKFNGEIACLPFGIPNLCTDRSKYVFFDPYHPSQATNEIVGRFLFETLKDDLRK